MRIILLRHGESEWNHLNKFTGWTDVDLTKNGVNEAIFSGNQLKKENITVNTLHTSILLRAINTANIVSEIVGFNKKKIQFDWRLNERHYGKLQGLNKSETAAKYGEKQVHIWRRSFHIAPPLLAENDKRHPKFNEKFKSIKEDLPIGESLKDVIDRLNPFFENYLSDIQKSDGNHLIVAHSNSLRAIVKILDKLSKDQIISINIPTGVPLIYTLDKNLNTINKEYLINKDTLKEKQEIIANQGKVK